MEEEHRLEEEDEKEEERLEMEIEKLAELDPDVLALEQGK